jgi:multiple sugar transport system substrate-binding protein
MRKIFLTEVLIISMSIFSGFALAKTETMKPVVLRIIWHIGPLGDLLRAISKEYTEQTGVEIQVELVSWAEWHDRIATEFAKKGDGFDLVIFDSQSMSEFASEGDVILLNPFLEKSTKLKALDYDPAALRMYSEYPEGSLNFYALPFNQDTMGLVYRRDLLNEPREVAAFREKYGYELTVPKTYDQLLDIAEFFTRPSENLYGIAMFGSQEYDAVTSTFNNILWSYGGELWNAKTRNADGVINSPPSVEALKYFKKLFDYSPKGSTSWFYEEVNKAIETGLVAMGINWYYFFSTYSDPKKNEYANKMGYAPLPGEKGIDGKFRQFNSVGGQGISISKHSRNVNEAWKFLEWFMSDETQWKWVRGGGQTGRVDILRSPGYLKATPYNSVFPLSMSRVKDYWHLVEYPELLEIYQKYVNLAISCSMSPQQALNNVAKDQQAILDKIK